MDTLDPHDTSSRWQPGVRLWFAWLLANAVGGALGGTLIELWGWAGLFLLGAALGIGQWLVLRPFLLLAGWWAVATAAGGMIGAAAIIGIAMVVAIIAGLVQWVIDWMQAVIPLPTALDLIPRILWSAGVGATLGAITGLLQWFVLREQLRASGGWVGAAAAGGALATAIAGLDLFPWTSPGPTESNPLSWAPNAIVSGIAFGAAYALITGVALAWLLRHRVAEVRPAISTNGVNAAT